MEAEGHQRARKKQGKLVSVDNICHVFSEETQVHIQFVLVAASIEGECAGLPQRNVTEIRQEKKKCRREI